MAAVGGYWDDGRNTEVWERASQRLVDQFLVYKVLIYDVWRSLKLYPGLLLMYAVGMGALGKWQSRTSSVVSSGVRSMTTIAEVDPRTNVLTALLISRSASDLMRKDMLEGYERNYVPINDWLHDALRETLRSFIPDDDRYSHVFDKFELLASLGFNSAQDHNSLFAGWFPLGSYIWRPGSLRAHAGGD